VSGAPRVSVLIKSYNHRPYVEQAVRSVLAQGFQDFELLVLDDASADGTPEVVRGIADPRIDLLVSDANMGPSLALKTLLERARGEYVAILNSDDFALPGRFEQQVEYLDRNPVAAAVFTTAMVVDEDGSEIPGRDLFEAPVRWPDHGRARWLRQFFFHGNCLCAPSAMLRRDMLREIGLPDPRFTNLHDLELWVRLASRHEIGFIPRPLTAFRIRADRKNLSALRPDTQLRAQFETSIILKHYARMPPALISEIFAPELGDHVLADEGDAKRFVAEIAMNMPLPSYRLFAMQTLFEAAEDRADYARLRTLTGQTDLFNFLNARINPHNRSFGTRFWRYLRRKVKF
jgi:glycosyltransferase involved in cell wall biosynthesis